MLLVSVTLAFFGATDEPLAARLSVLLAAVIAWAWIVATLVGAARARAAWARGSALTIHVLLFAAGTGILQGIIGEPELGLALILLAGTGFTAAVLARVPATDVPAVDSDAEESANPPHVP